MKKEKYLLFTAFALNVMACEPPEEATLELSLVELSEDIKIDSWRPEVSLPSPNISLELSYSEQRDALELGEVKVVFKEGDAKRFEYSCTAAFAVFPPVESGTASVILDCPDKTMSEWSALCDAQAPTLVVTQLLNGVSYQTEPVSARVLCSDDPRQSDILELEGEPLPEGRPCALEEGMSGEFSVVEQFAWKDNHLLFVDHFEEGTRVDREAYAYNSDGTVATIIAVDNEGTELSIVEYSYASGELQSQRILFPNGTEEVCTYDFQEGGTVWSECSNEPVTFTWDPEGKTVEVEDSEGKNTVVAYRGELAGGSEFLTLNAVELFKSLLPTEFTLGSKSARIVFNYADDLLLSSELSVNGQLLQERNYLYSCQ